MRTRTSEAIAVIILSVIVLGSSIASSSLIQMQTIPSYVQIRESTSVNGTLKVKGRLIVNEFGQTIYLRGLTRSGLEMAIGSEGMNQTAVNSGDYGSLIVQSDFAVMASMGADCVRLPFGWGWLEPQIGVYNMTYVTRLEQIIGWIEGYGMYVILCLGNNGLTYPRVASWITDPGFFTNATQQQSFIDLWTWLSQRYQNDPRILYDLINEPYSPALSFTMGYDNMTSYVYPVLYNSSGLYARTIAALRANGDDKICIVEPVGGDSWGVVGTDGVTYPIKLSDPNVLYSAHWYYPSNSGDSMDWHNTLVTSAYQFSINNNVPFLVGEWGIPWESTTLSVSEQTYWTQEHCQTYANLGFNWCYWSFKRDKYAVYYSDEGSAIFNDTLRPMASVLTEYMSRAP
jgi:aryl-phospho-beta-D-glucosidase BglC (GH1 family)